MTTIIADVTTHPEANGGLPWGLWHDLRLFLLCRPEGKRYRVEVKEVEQYGAMEAGTTHIVCLDVLDCRDGEETFAPGSEFDLTMDRWTCSDYQWQTKDPIAFGTVTHSMRVH